MQQSVNTQKSRKTMSARVIAQIGILAAISYFLRFIEVPLPIFPSFLKLDLSDIVAVFGGLSQIGAIGDNLAETPISKILMYVSLSSITLILIVFISFNILLKFVQ